MSMVFQIVLLLIALMISVAVYTIAVELENVVFAIRQLTVAVDRARQDLAEIRNAIKDAKERQ